MSSDNSPTESASTTMLNLDQRAVQMHITLAPVLQNYKNGTQDDAADDAAIAQLQSMIEAIQAKKNGTLKESGNAEEVAVPVSDKLWEGTDNVVQENLVLVLSRCEKVIEEHPLETKVLHLAKHQLKCMTKDVKQLIKKSMRGEIEQYLSGKSGATKKGALTIADSQQNVAQVIEPVAPLEVVKDQPATTGPSSSAPDTILTEDQLVLKESEEKALETDEVPEVAAQPKSIAPLTDSIPKSVVEAKNSPSELPSQVPVAPTSIKNQDEDMKKSDDLAAPLVPSTPLSSSAGTSAAQKNDAQPNAPIAALTTAIPKSVAEGNNSQPETELPLQVPVAPIAIKNQDEEMEKSDDLAAPIIPFTPLSSSAGTSVVQKVAAQPTVPITPLTNLIPKSVAGENNSQPEVEFPPQVPAVPIAIKNQDEEVNKSDDLAAPIAPSTPLSSSAGTSVVQKNDAQPNAPIAALTTAIPKSVAEGNNSQPEVELPPQMPVAPIAIKNQDDEMKKSDVLAAPIAPSTPLSSSAGTSAVQKNDSLPYTVAPLPTNPKCSQSKTVARSALHRARLSLPSFPFTIAAENQATNEDLQRKKSTQDDSAMLATKINRDTLESFKVLMESKKQNESARTSLEAKPESSIAGTSTKKDGSEIQQEEENVSDHVDVEASQQINVESSSEGIASAGPSPNPESLLPTEKVELPENNKPTTSDNVHADENDVTKNQDEVNTNVGSAGMEDVEPELRDPEHRVQNDVPEDAEVPNTPLDRLNIPPGTCYICFERDHFSKIGKLSCDTPNCQVNENGSYYSFVNGQEQLQFCLDCCEKNEELKEKVKNIERRHNVPVEEEKARCTMKECENFAHHRCLSLKDSKAALKCWYCKQEAEEERVEPFKAADIPHTTLSRRGEEYLKTHPALRDEPISLRELQSSRCKVILNDICPKKYERSFSRMKDKMYTARTLGVFQNVGGRDAFIAIFFMEEYEPISRQRWVVVGYLDTIQLYPRENEKKSLNGIAARLTLQFYFSFMGENGFTDAHLWAKAPKEGMDYCFNLHPSAQKYLAQDQLVEWYKGILDKLVEGTEEGGRIKGYKTFEGLKIEIQQISDIKKLHVFSNSLWFYKMDWAISVADNAWNAADAGNKPNKDQLFLDQLKTYMEEHKADNFYLELDAIKNKHLHLANNGPLRTVPIMKKQENCQKYFSDNGLTFHDLRNNFHSTEVVIAKVLRVVNPDLFEDGEEGEEDGGAEEREE